ncbi:hypothetical protein AAIG85_33460, partial [Pseudomonas aeruginosa]|uniref:hypothetical protein n=1 Tax=Pseudomonas aeruginosa TaxID=287 RepID=UPI0031B73312
GTREFHAPTEREGGRVMPSAAEFQALSDELRQLGAVIVQAANLGDQELALWAVGALSSAAARPAWWAREAADSEAVGCK